MYSFNEIVARLVIVASVVIIVETRARYIYQPGPFVECMKLEIPCGGHTKESCNEYCEGNGFLSGSCSGHCCVCFARPYGMLPIRPMLRQRQHSVNRLIPATDGTRRMTDLLEIRPLPMTIAQRYNRPYVEENLEVSTSKPKRFVSNDQFSEPIGNNDLSNTNDDDLDAKADIPNYDLGPSEEPSSAPPTVTEIVPKENTDLCLTPDCVKTANSILEKMDETVSPCDDFYEFTCGNFEKDQPIPDHKSAITLMGSITDKLTEQLRKMLEEESQTELSYSSRLAKTLYDSCRNSDLLESSGVTPLYNLLKTLGGWPVLEGDNWNSATWSWEKTVANLRKSGLAMDYLLKVSVVPDLKHPSRRILHIGEPALSINREQLPNPFFMEAYCNYQIDVAALLGADKAQAEQEMASVLQFERVLANISLPRELSRAHPLNFYHPMSISKLQNLFPSVQWLDYVNSLLPENVTVDDDQVVTVHVPEHLTLLLDTIDKTDNRVLANYLLWRVSSSVLPYLSENAMQLQQKFVGTFSGRKDMTPFNKERKPRWRECVDVVSSTLGQAVGAMYVRQHFDESSKDVAIEMVDDIQKAFADLLASMEWMDADTKKRAFEKLTAMKANIGYPNELLDEENLKKLYNGLQLSSDNFFGNLLNLTKGATNFVLEKLHEPVVKNDWIRFGKPAMVNAFYQPITNSIQFPAGILQGHFFDKSRPSFMNYGAIGWVIGHEITHGFDDQGSHFDHNGELQDWWNPRTKQLFHEKARCLVNQYGSFTYKDEIHNVTIPINGIISVGENIADNGGIKQAYKGYQAWVQRNGPEKKLPGLNYTPDQLFWISAASNWCSKVRPQQMAESIHSGVHSPGQYRVRGTFANMEQFAKDFSCPVGSPMNPPSKCDVW